MDHFRSWYIDSGLIVAALNEKDDLHAEVLQVFRTTKGKLTSTVACLEALGVLRRKLSKADGHPPSITEMSSLWNRMVDLLQENRVDLHYVGPTNMFEEDGFLATMGLMAGSPISGTPLEERCVRGMWVSWTSFISRSHCL